MPRTLPAGHASVNLTSDASPTAIQDLLAEIHRRHDLLEAVELRVSHDLAESDFGGVGAATQAIATWARNDRLRVLHTYFETVDAGEILRTLKKQDHLLSAVLVAKRILSQDRDDITHRVKQLADETLSDQDTDPIQRRRRAFIACLDDYQWHGISPWLYDGAPSRPWLRDPVLTPEDPWPYASSRPPRVKPASELERVLRSFYRELGVFGTLRSPDDNPFSQLATAASEMFDNTERWSKRAPLLDHPLGRTFRPSLRTFRMKWIDGSSEVLQRHGDGDRVLRRYLTESLVEHRWQSFLEFSILDSGPGLFARRLNGWGIDWVRSEAADQHRALIDCLVADSTDDPSGAGENRGKGFTLAFAALTNLKGFFRARTGRLSLSRDLARDGYVAEDHDHPRLWDSQTGEQDRITEHPSAVGTQITMVFPLARS